MSFGYKEDLLQFIWEFQLYDPSGLCTTADESITIIKQGYLNKNSGPDFENAQVKIGSITHFGSVEIHVDGREWQHHAHHLDTAYNNVILHVCYTSQAEELREDGSSMPTLNLASRINKSALRHYELLMSTKPFVPCENQLKNINPFAMAGWLDRMIIERIEERCTLFESYLESSLGDWSQAFYTAVVRSFGMPVNTDSFEEIAFKLPYDLIMNHHSSLFQLEALFFGVAGLLEEDLQDNYYTGLKNEFSFLKNKYGLNNINSSLKMGRIRPMNLPHVKLAQLAAFFHHKPQFINQVLMLPTAAELKTMLRFELSEYWEKHYTFRKESKTKIKSISKTFSNHIYLNAIIPFVFYYLKNKTEQNTDAALDYLAAIDAEKNSIVTRWKSIGAICENAAHSQALLHLYKTYCKPQRCLQCNLGKKILLNHDVLH
jgi:hypothetical protein